MRGGFSDTKEMRCISCSERRIEEKGEREGMGEEGRKEERIEGKGKGRERGLMT